MFPLHCMLEPLPTSIGGPPPLHIEGVIKTAMGVVHVPKTHSLPAGHLVPHAPQFELSVLVFVHSLPHAVSPGRHELSHAPPVQTWVPVHFTPQPPQLFGSVEVGMH
jgi:hypothetical protein